MFLLSVYHITVRLLILKKLFNGVDQQKIVLYCQRRFSKVLGRLKIQNQSTKTHKLGKSYKMTELN